MEIWLFPFLDIMIHVTVSFISVQVLSGSMFFIWVYT